MDNYPNILCDQASQEAEEEAGIQAEEAMRQMMGANPPPDECDYVQPPYQEQQQQYMDPSYGAPPVQNFSTPMMNPYMMMAAAAMMNPMMNPAMMNPAMMNPAMMGFQQPMAQPPPLQRSSSRRGSRITVSEPRNLTPLFDREDPGDLMVIDEDPFNLNTTPPRYGDLEGLEFGNYSGIQQPADPSPLPFQHPLPEPSSPFRVQAPAAHLCAAKPFEMPVSCPTSSLFGEDFVSVFDTGYQASNANLDPVPEVPEVCALPPPSQAPIESCPVEDTIDVCAAPKAKVAKKPTLTTKYVKKEKPPKGSEPAAPPAKTSRLTSRARPPPPASSPPPQSSRPLLPQSPPRPSSRPPMQSSPPIQVGRPQIPSSPPIHASRQIPSSPPIPTSRPQIPSSPPIPTSRPQIPSSPPIQVGRPQIPSSPPIQTGKSQMPFSPPIQTKQPPMASSPPIPTRAAKPAPAKKSVAEIRKQREISEAPTKSEVEEAHQVRQRFMEEIEPLSAQEAQPLNISEAQVFEKSRIAEAGDQYEEVLKVSDQVNDWLVDMDSEESPFEPWLAKSLLSIKDSLDGNYLGFQRNVVYIVEVLRKKFGNMDLMLQEVDESLRKDEGMDTFPQMFNKVMGTYELSEKLAKKADHMVKIERGQEMEYRKYLTDINDNLSRAITDVGENPIITAGLDPTVLYLRQNKEVHKQALESNLVLLHKEIELIQSHLNEDGAQDHPMLKQLRDLEVYARNVLADIEAEQDRDAEYTQDMLNKVQTVTQKMTKVNNRVANRVRELVDQDRRTIGKSIDELKRQANTALDDAETSATARAMHEARALRTQTRKLTRFEVKFNEMDEIFGEGLMERMENRRKTLTTEARPKSAMKKGKKAEAKNLSVKEIREIQRGKSPLVQMPDSPEKTTAKVKKGKGKSPASGEASAECPTTPKAKSARPRTSKTPTRPGSAGPTKAHASPARDQLQLSPPRSARAPRSAPQRESPAPRPKSTARPKTPSRRQAQAEAQEGAESCPAPTTPVRPTAKAPARTSGKTPTRPTAPRNAPKTPAAGTSGEKKTTARLNVPKTPKADRPQWEGGPVEAPDPNAKKSFSRRVQLPEIQDVDVQVQAAKGGVSMNFFGDVLQQIEDVEQERAQRKEACKPNPQKFLKRKSAGMNYPKPRQRTDAGSAKGKRAG